jgi:hypothetical protein
MEMIKGLEHRILPLQIHSSGQFVPTLMVIMCGLFYNDFSSFVKEFKEPKY